MIETGLDLTGVIKGLIHGRFPSVRGHWCGVVNYAIPYADPHLGALRIVDQLVPFAAIRLQK